MREKILHTASQLFLNIGFKSVTMDDIAEKMAISKKTIYEYYKNKTDLVKAAVRFVFEQITERIDTLCSEENETSPIQTLFDINHFLLNYVKENRAPEYQLKKYYPQIAMLLDEKRFNAITCGITENLERGVEAGVYRKDIDIPVIARLYYSTVSAIKISDLFPLDEFKISEVMHTFLLYHIRGISTDKGLQELEIYLKQNEK